MSSDFTNTEAGLEKKKKRKTFDNNLLSEFKDVSYLWYQFPLCLGLCFFPFHLQNYIENIC